MAASPHSAFVINTQPPPRQKSQGATCSQHLRSCCRGTGRLACKTHQNSSKQNIWAKNSTSTSPRVPGSSTGSSGCSPGWSLSPSTPARASPGFHPRTGRAENCHQHTLAPLTSAFWESRKATARSILGSPWALLIAAGCRQISMKFSHHCRAETGLSRGAVPHFNVSGHWHCPKNLNSHLLAKKLQQAKI